jgi:hypothetical protein
MQCMNGFSPLCEFAFRADVYAAIEDARTARESDRRPGAAQRTLVQDGLVLDAGGTQWRSLWLLSHRALRRAGLRRHASDAVVAGWRGTGLLLLRAPGNRRSIALAPLEPDGDDEWVRVPAETPFDTLADERPWHVLMFHAHPASSLVRWQETLEGWVEKPEEADS